MKRFTMKQLPYEGANFWQVCFTFDAADQTEADRKAEGWREYHSMYRGHVKAEPSTAKEAEWNTNNNYVDRY